MRKKRATIGECAYCLKVTEVTRDPVIPKCLFPKPRPANPVIVPACLECNHKKSETDDYLRDFLVLDAFASENPLAQSIFNEGLLSSVRQRSSGLAKTALAEAKLHTVYSPGGIYLGEVLSFAIEGHEIFSRIARGLYYNIRRQRIPNDYQSETD